MLEAVDGVATVDLAGVDRALDLQVVTLYYDRSLSALDLAPGPLVPVTDGPRPLPEPVFLRSVTVRPDEVLPWTTVLELPPALAAVRLGPAGRQCPDFGEVEIPDITFEHGTARFILPLGDSEALVGTQGRAMFRVRTDGTARQLVVPAGLPTNAAALVETSSVPAGVDPAARLVYLAGSDRRLWSAWVSSTIEQATELLPASGAGEIHWLDSRDGGRELYALTDLGHLLVRSAGGWTELFPHRSNSPPRSRPFLAGGLTRNVAGEVFAAHESTPALVHVVGPDCHQHTLDPTEAVAGVATAPDGGTVATTVNGRLFEHVPSDDTWRALSPQLPTTNSESVAPYESGWLVPGQRGQIAYYRPGDTVCKVELKQPRSVFFAVPVGRHLVVGTDVTYVNDTPAYPPFAVMRRRSGE